MEQNKPLTGKDKLDEYFKLVSGLVKSGFYGELVTKFEAGNIVIIKRTESIKLNQ